MVGLTPAADRKFKGYSLGMRQRLGIAAALLGDPEVLILDEPANGLDPEGIRWMRDLLKSLADEGRTVLVSSHLLSEMEILADDVVIIAAGQAGPAGPGGRVIDSIGHDPDAGTHAASRTQLLAALGAAVTVTRDRATGRCCSSAPTVPTIGAAAMRVGAEIHELTMSDPTWRMSSSS